MNAAASRWLSRVTLAVAVIMIGRGAMVVFDQPVTAWFAVSATIWMALLLSVDNAIRQSDFQSRWPRLRAARLLFL
jgi:hypothetical protein